MKKVKDIMTRDIAILPREANVDDVVKVMKNHRISCVIIMKDDIPEGIITETDVLTKVIVKSRDPSKVSVEEVMTSPVMIIDPEMPFTRVSKLMKEKSIRRFPVVDHNMLLGLVTQTDIANATIDYLEKLNAKLKQSDISLDDFHEISGEFYELGGHTRDRPDIKHMAMEIMSTDMQTVKPDGSVYDAALRILDTSTNCVVVVDDSDSPLGMITERDLISKVLFRRLDPKKTRVSEVMSTPLITVSPESKVDELGNFMRTHNVRRLVVVANGELVGIVTHSGISHNVIDMALAIHSDIMDKWDAG
ncbi:CBS domain-containing protein [Candidatus Woesearchaeota archaeon]|nr:CBS domain-containing protein [Candidatus Woesearchaeota archaeon]